MAEMKVGCASYQEAMQRVRVVETIGLFARYSQFYGMTGDIVQEMELRFCEMSGWTRL